MISFARLNIASFDNNLNSNIGQFKLTFKIRLYDSLKINENFFKKNVRDVVDKYDSFFENSDCKENKINIENVEQKTKELIYFIKKNELVKILKNAEIKTLDQLRDEKLNINAKLKYLNYYNIQNGFNECLWKNVYEMFQKFDTRLQEICNHISNSLDLIIQDVQYLNNFNNLNQSKPRNLKNYLIENLFGPYQTFVANFYSGISNSAKDCDDIERYKGTWEKYKSKIFDDTYLNNINDILTEEYTNKIKSTVNNIDNLINSYIYSVESYLKKINDLVKQTKKRGELEEENKKKYKQLILNLLVK